MDPLSRMRNKFSFGRRSSVDPVRIQLDESSIMDTDDTRKKSRIPRLTVPSSSNNRSSSCDQQPWNGPSSTAGLLFTTQNAVTQGVSLSARAAEDCISQLSCKSRAGRKDRRNISDKGIQMELAKHVCRYLNQVGLGSDLFFGGQGKTPSGPIEPMNLKNINTNSFINLFNFLFKELGAKGRIEINSSNFMEKIPYIAKKLNYPGIINKSHLQTLSYTHSWPYIIAFLGWMVDLAIAAKFYERQIKDTSKVELIFLRFHLAAYNAFNRKEIAGPPSEEDIDILQKELCEMLNVPDNLMQELRDARNKLKTQLEHEMAKEKQSEDELLKKREQIKQLTTKVEQDAEKIREMELKKETLAKEREEVAHQKEILVAKLTALRKEKDILALTCSKQKMSKTEWDTLASKKKELEEDIRMIDEINRNIKVTLSKIDTQLKSRRNKMMSNLESQLAELRARLRHLEAGLLSPLTFVECTKEEVETMLRNHEELQGRIDDEVTMVNDVVSLCDQLLRDGEDYDVQLDSEYIQNSRDNIIKMWKNIANLSSNKKMIIQLVWTLLLDMLKLCDEHEEWVNTELQTLEEITQNTPELSKEYILNAISRVEEILNDIESRNPALKILEQSYSKLTKETGFNYTEMPLTAEDAPSEMRSEDSIFPLPLKRVRSIIMCWNYLLKKAVESVQSLRFLLNLFLEFTNAHQRVVVALTQTDIQLTNLEHLCDSEERYDGVLRLEKEVQAYTPLLKSMDSQGQTLLDRSRQGEGVVIQSMMEEYWTIWKEIERRLYELKASIPHDVESKVEAKKYSEVDESVQVDTLKFEKDSAIQVDTLSPPLSFEGSQITSREAYLMELETALGECTGSLESLQSSIQSPTPQGDEVTPATSALVKMIGLCHSSMELVKHLSNLLIQECSVSEEEARTEEINILYVRYQELLTLAKAREQHLRSIGDRARLTCPLCSKKNWQQLDNDLWRLEKWLDYAEGTQKSLGNVPTNIEQLEDAIQDNREFLMDLDSHRNIVVSLNIVGKHLADHTEDIAKANELRSRLVVTNARWEKVCQDAARWQTRLQTSLMENHEFHQIIDELVNWLEKTENSIRQTEPVDLTEELSVIEEKYNKFRELLADLEKCEPRVLSLQEAADHLLKQSPPRGGPSTSQEAGSGGHPVWERLTNLRLRLQSLHRICRVYVLKLGSVLGKDPSEIGLAAAGTLGSESLSRLSEELLDQTAQSGRTHLQGPTPTEQQHPTGDDEVEDRTVLSRSYRFLGRVLRASLPIQAALMLLLVGVASLVLNAEEDYSCALANNFARSFETMLTYPDGPPPV